MPLKIGNNKIKELYVGNQKIKEVYVGSHKVYSSVKQFTLTLASGVSANRTSSPSGYGSIGAIASGAAIFEGDTLTFSGAAKASTYTAWNPAHDEYILPTPTASSGDNTSPFINVKCNNSKLMGIYRRTTDMAGNVIPGTEWTVFGEHMSPEVIQDTNVAWNTRYEYHIAGTAYRTRTDYTPVLSQTSATVTGNISVTLFYSETQETESQWDGGGVVGVVVPQQNTYAFDFLSNTGISSIFSSTNKNATSGNASGTYYPYGTTVYLIFSVSSGYTAPSGYTYNSSTGYYYKAFTVYEYTYAGRPTPTVNTITVTFNTSTSVTTIVITKPDNTTVIADSTGFAGNPSQPVTINPGQTLKWSCGYNSGYYIPTTTTTRTFNSNATITPSAAQVTATTVTLTSRNQVRLIMEATNKFVTKVTATNNKSGNSVLYAGWSTYSTTAGTTWWNGTSFTKNSSKTVTPEAGYVSGYFTMNATTTSPNWSLTVYSCTNNGWNFG